MLRETINKLVDIRVHILEGHREMASRELEGFVDYMYQNSKYIFGDSNRINWVGLKIDTSPHKPSDVTQYFNYVVDTVKRHLETPA
jgi:hypothetical protein